VDWIGIALAIVGIGLALWPLAFGELPEVFRPLTGYVAIALVVIGLLMCLIPLWKRIQNKREEERLPRSLAILKKLLEGNDAFKGVQSADDFSKVIVALASKGLIKIFGIPGELKGATNMVQEIQPSYFKNHSIWIQWTDNGVVSETYRNDVPFMNAIMTDKGRYFNLQASPNTLDEIAKYVLAEFKRVEEQKVTTSPEADSPSTPTFPHA
jgi:hypothetical protein